MEVSQRFSRHFAAPPEKLKAGFPNLDFGARDNRFP
jgi:hypothetical protein